ncbi:response regulator transcription factor [Clostridium sp. cel8]|uniref:LytR/AlgR family response regulator transcription factor n=1 Tax=Clostridium sp. cel8 TaxID=2663123 RepID=UPI0015F44FF2|nr:LytTR family DNA-binding domain-containing protein [Clostridium sp. cel8]MBA5850180.1 response regulator transcription factor [Clostridium sp. cel8]
MVNVLVVEDDEIERKNLAKIIFECDKNIRVFEASSKYESLKIIKDIAIDFFYIDIALNDSSGIDLALELRRYEQYKLSWIIFVTSNEKYILEAFKKTHCYDYILKPYDKEDIIKMTKLLVSGTYEVKKSLKMDKYVSFNMSSDISVRIKVKDIIFIMVNLRVMTIYTKDRIYKFKNMSLKKALNIIDSDYIVQTHRAYAVNINFISSIQKVSNKSWEISFNSCKYRAFLSYNFKVKIMKKIGEYM